MAKKHWNVEKKITVNGEEITVWQIEHDVNGNPRYVVHFLSLGVQLADYGKIPGLKRYMAKWFGGGYVIQSHNIQSDLDFYMDTVRRWYENKAKLEELSK